MKKNTVRLRKANVEDYYFWKSLDDDINNEILYGCNKLAFPWEEICDEYKEILTSLENNNCEIFEFDEVEITEEKFERKISNWGEIIYIIELCNKNISLPIGCFQLLKRKHKQVHLFSFLMQPDFFKLMDEALEELLKRKELAKKEITVCASKTDIVRYWLPKHGFTETDSFMMSHLKS